MKGLPEKIQWHPAFAGAIELEFRDDHKYVIIQQEYNLSKEPIRIDLLISRKDGNSRKFGNTLFPVQIVVVKELNSTLHSSLRVLSDSADREDVETFIQNSVKTSEPWEREDIDAVLQASVSANKELYEEIRRDSGMCQALRELMKDEIDKEIEGAEARGEANLISNMYNNGVTPEQISSMTDMELDKVKRIIYGNKPVVV